MIGGKKTLAAGSGQWQARQADALYPECMACMSLAQIYDNRNEPEEAERYWREATSYDQERIAYWMKLGMTLSARLKFGEADAATERAHFLEELYRSR